MDTSSVAFLLVSEEMGFDENHQLRLEEKQSFLSPWKQTMAAQAHPEVRQGLQGRRLTQTENDPELPHYLYPLLPGLLE